MNSEFTSDRRRPNCAFPIFAAIMFALAHTQASDFYSNQNQYYLHGLADAGYGDLARDWLANTADPTPLFSALVEGLYRLGGTLPLLGVYFGVQMLYFLSLWRIGQSLRWFPGSFTGEAVVAASLIVVHSATIRLASVELIGIDYPWYFQTGIANQYLLGPVLQPSVFGVFLLTALAAFVADRPIFAAIAVALAATIHTTYLLPGAMLIVGMMIAQIIHRDWLKALITGIVALVGVMPVLIYTLMVFGPENSERFASAQEILAWTRIPHHTRIEQWLDLVALLQLGGICVGIALGRGSRIFPVLVTATLIAVLLSGLQYLTGNATLALLFPWRLSAVLVPIATLAIAAVLGKGIEQLLPNRVVSAAAFLIMVLTAIASMVLVGRGFGYQESAGENGLLQYVRSHRQPGDVYLLPTRFPGPPKGRGSYSSTFVPKDPNATGSSIFELQRFRLATGAATYVDFKSIPYRDVDVLEWQQRVANSERWFQSSDWDRGTLEEIVQTGITHVVAPSDASIHSSRFEPVYSDAAYAVYRIVPMAESR